MFDTKYIKKRNWVQNERESEKERNFVCYFSPHFFYVFQGTENL